ncbi:odorant receptor 85c-like [Trichoplusia ni]|uniref:Odorant receptor n=1 Tax=Trichoplusia ni TaxID=7111 RepID=A0A7E5WM36_TRINI|nr:odorant receptor 85c-like [Trichoplusia ni]
MLYSNLPQDYKKTFSRYIYLFKFIGIQFFDEPNGVFTKANLKLTVFVITFLPFVIGQFSLISKIRIENFLESVRVVPVDIMFFLDLVKLSILIIRRSDIRDMFLEIGELWPKGLKSDEEKSVILKAWLKRIRIPLDFFFFFAIANLCLFEVIPFIMSCFNISHGMDVYVFPFKPPNVWNINSTFVFLITYLWEISCTVPCQMCVYLPFDLLIVTMTSNVSALLRLLQIDLKNAIKLRDSNMLLKNNIHKSDSDGYQEVKTIIETHQKLLRIADQLSNIFGIVIFIHAMFAALEICFFGFLTVICVGPAETIANFLTVLSAVFTIFLLSLSGQLLCDTSSEVADAAYQSYWYESDVKVKKLILFIIIRAQRPSYLSALGFSELTLRSFSKIMSSSWTYLSLLLQVYEET